MSWAELAHSSPGLQLGLNILTYDSSIAGRVELMDFSETNSTGSANGLVSGFEVR